MKKQRSPYISNLPPRENHDPKPWTCRECKQEMNKDGRCANIANFLCPKCWNKKLNESTTCQRCGTRTNELYPVKIKQEDEYGDEKEVEIKICWSCNHDVMNGGDIDADAREVLQDRAEIEYEYDPINNERPW